MFAYQLGIIINCLISLQLKSFQFTVFEICKLTGAKYSCSFAVYFKKHFVIEAYKQMVTNNLVPNNICPAIKLGVINGKNYYLWM